MDQRMFDFAFDTRFQPWLLALGVTPGNASAVVDDEGLHVRFGLWSIDTPIANIAGGELSGPYRWFRSIGVRVSLKDRGLTFGSSVHEGVCLRFNEPITGADPLGLIRHPGLTLTLRRNKQMLGELQRRGAVFLAA